MTRLLLVLLAASICWAAYSQPASAHKAGWCGHTSVYWTVWSYGQQIEYREVYKYDYYSGGVHFHVVSTLSNQAGTLNWTLIHQHHRACGATHS